MDKAPTSHEYLKERYARLWTGGVDRIRTGAVEIDPVLAGKQVDRRRGLTLVIRPCESVRRRVGAFLEDLRKIEPDQYFYAPDELHVTFLSLFTATVEHESFFAREAEYVDAVASSLRALNSFTLRFEGITASPGAIMVQGFMKDATLNSARDRLREELRARGLVKGLDERYRLETAHMTIARFRHPLRDGRTLAEALQQKRHFEFGESVVAGLELVKNDWYVSRGNLQRVRDYIIGGC